MILTLNHQKLEIDAALDIANGLHYLENLKLDALNECTVKTFKTLCGMI